MSKFLVQKLFILFFLYSCLTLTLGCKMNNNLIYTYSDGSGNSYIINSTGEKILEYNPVKPHSSSSGTYDGGNYRKIKINESQFSKITSSFNKAIVNKKNQIENRVMGSGLIIIQENKNKKTYILKPGSIEQLELEKTLKEFLKNGDVH